LRGSIIRGNDDIVKPLVEIFIQTKPQVQFCFLLPKPTFK
jgi:hypothetical protein